MGSPGVRSRKLNSPEGVLPTGVAHATPFLWRLFWYAGQGASERVFVTRFRVEPPLLVSRDFRAERPSHLLFVGGGSPKPIALAALIESVRCLMEDRNPLRLAHLSVTREMYETCVVRGHHTITGTFLLKRRGDSGWQVLALHRNPFLNRLVRIIREKIYGRQNKDFDNASSPWPDIRNCYPDWLKAFQANGVKALLREHVDSLLWSTDEFGVSIPTFLPWACTIVYRDLESLSHIEASLRHGSISQVLKILEADPENFGTMKVPQSTRLLNPFDRIQFILPYLEAHWACCQVIFRPTVSPNAYAADVFALINQAMRESITRGIPLPGQIRCMVKSPFATGRLHSVHVTATVSRLCKGKGVSQQKLTEDIVFDHREWMPRQVRIEYTSGGLPDHGARRPLLRSEILAQLP
jgi:hypothetical protein